MKVFDPTEYFKCKYCELEVCNECGVCKCQLHKWISVKDRMPDAFTDVLAFCVALEDDDNYKKGQKYCAIDCYCIWKGLPPTFRTNKFYPAKVTHWMPLPNLPEENE